MEEHIDGGNQWAKVTGPMSAAYMHLKEMGWMVETNEANQIWGLIDENGDIWSPNDAVTWVDFQEQLEKPALKRFGKKPRITEVGQTWRKGPRCFFDQCRWGAGEWWRRQCIMQI